MNKEYQKIVDKYKDFKKTFKYAYIGIPKGINGLKEPFFGTLEKFLKLYPNFNLNKKIPTNVYSWFCWFK